MKRPPRFVLGVGATTVLLAVVMTSQQTQSLPFAQPAPAHERRAARAPDLSHQHRWLVHALFTNLLDDDEPPRWAEPDSPVTCSDGTDVRVDGAPLRPGARLPATDFTIDLRLDGACPLGHDGPRLWGAVRLLVVRDDDAGLVSVVLQQHGL